MVVVGGAGTGIVVLSSVQCIQMNASVLPRVGPFVQL